ncbi:hypothetical protein ACHAXT_004702 [Thalassiosira profunda]
MKLPTALRRHHGSSPTQVLDGPVAKRRSLTSPEPKPGSVRASELVCNLAAMQQSEEAGAAYDPCSKFDYKHDEQQDDGEPKSQLLVDENCRLKMLDWCAKMVDYFAIDRSIVSTAAYYQDRFLSTDAGLEARSNRTMFRVVSVTSLYIAIKLRLPHRWNVSSHAFAQLCQGAVSGDEIHKMESKILFALRWKVNPATPMEYVHIFLDLIFDGQEVSPFEQDLREHLLELVRYQLEIALQDSRLFQVSSCAVATAAVLNALEASMKESASIHDDIEMAFFCQESIVLVFDTAESCRGATADELEGVRSILLSSVASPAEEKGVVVAVTQQHILCGIFLSESFAYYNYVEVLAPGQGTR